MNDHVKNFWIKYNYLDEFEQRKHLSTLTGVNKEGFFNNMTMTLFKSYIDDAIAVNKK